MNFIASGGQLRASFLRWALFTVPLIVLLGFVSGQTGGPGTIWFANLVKPNTYPDGAIFGIVWSILYVMIGLALALVCSAWGARGRGLAIGLFAVHILLNFAWSPVFFAMQNIQGALYLIAAIIVTLLPVLWMFWRIRKSAALLLIPYLAWLCFAATLNYEFHRLNPDGGSDEISAPPQRFEI